MLVEEYYRWDHDLALNPATGELYWIEEKYPKSAGGTYTEWTKALAPYGANGVAFWTSTDNNNNPV
jgi:hypothetical protein